MTHSRAQIVATIGPASGSEDTLKRMVASQLDVVRLNFSWGTYAEHEQYIRAVRKAAGDAGRQIPIIQDLSGPRAQEKSGHQFNVESDIITEKDIKDLSFGLGQRVDYVAMSYVGKPSDVLLLRAEMQKIGIMRPVIAKIERQIAVENLDAIIDVADAVMVARGDLGNEVPLERIPFIERAIIQKCKAAGKPVITATQMMLSMTENPKPTRAEVTDVAFAIINGSDAVMLSEESASGKYPVEAVAMMEKIVAESERHLGAVKVNPLVVFEANK